MFRVIVKSYLLYIITFAISALLLELGASILNTNTFFLVELFNLNLDQIEVIYPNHTIIAYLILAALKYNAFLLYLIIFYLFVFWYRKSLQRNILLKIFLIYSFSFIVDRSLNFIDYKKILGLKYNGREFDVNINNCQQTEADENGINKYIKNNKCLSAEHKINEQGFRSVHDFSKDYIDSLRQSNKVIMFIGDSHTEGCCASPVTNSFVDIVDSKPGILALNFGVGGTDPLQYHLIAEHYVPELKPDIVVVVFCIYNDYMNYDRKPVPFKPVYYQTDYKWFDAYLPWTHPEYEPNKMFKNWDAAREYYVENYSIFGSEISISERLLISPYSINSLLYYIGNKIPGFIRIIINANKSDAVSNYFTKEPSISFKHLSEIEKITKEIKSELILVAVPDVNKIEKEFAELQNKINTDFYPIQIHYPNDFTEAHFISKESNHFNNVGHKKYADFLVSLISDAD